MGHHNQVELISNPMISPDFFSIQQGTCWQTAELVLAHECHLVDANLSTCSRGEESCESSHPSYHLSYMYIYIYIYTYLYIYIYICGGPSPLYLPFVYFYWYLHAFLTNLEKCYTHTYILYIYIYDTFCTSHLDVFTSSGKQNGPHIVCIKPFHILQF